MPLLSHFVYNPMPFYRLMLKLCALLCSAWALSGHAQLTSVPSAGIALSKIEVLHDVPQGLALAQVQSGEAGPFVPQDNLHTSHRTWNRAVWLRLHLSALPILPAQLAPAVLILPTPYLDKARLYTPGAQAAAPWPVQQAGDFLDPHTWAQRGFHPKFSLPPLNDPAWQGGREIVLYLQLDHFAPVSFDVDLADAAQALDRDLLSLLIFGLGLGMILLAAILTASLAWAHRDPIYAWYCVYAIFAALGCSSHAGIAQNVLWPVGGYWPGTAALCFVLLCALCQVQFSLALNSDRFARHALRYFAHAISLLCFVLAICFAIFTDCWKAFYFATLPLLACAMGLSIWLIVMGLKAGHRLAMVWLLSYVPLFCTIVVALLEGIGILPSGYWPYNLVIYLAILEVLILGLALQWFSNERHGEIERRKALATVDPLTGFVSAQAFETQLKHDWEISLRRGRPLAVAYVQLQTRANSEQHRKQLLTRSVRILRSATSAQDVVARLDGTLLAVLIHDVQTGDELNQRLSRIVALGLMPDASDRLVSVLQFRIAVTTRGQFKKPLQELDAQLRELLAEPNSKPIRYIDHTQKKRIHPFVLDSIALEETWDAAFKNEISSSAQGGSSSR
jgi:two-component system, sensor histidine kinase LadS